MNSIKNFPYNDNGTGLQISEIPTLPTGTIIPYSTASAPDGYLSCNGAAISRETYKKLFAIIGTTYGSGDGSTTFNLPNLSGAMIPTDSNVAVKGNGKQLGLTDGTRSAGVGIVLTDSTTRILSPSSPIVSGNLPTSQGGSRIFSSGSAIGLNTNPALSGIVGKLNSITVSYFIKY